jgi:hypothetical protein
MKNIFAIAVIVLFALASIPEAIDHNWPKSLFYVFSALINVTILFLSIN